MNLQEQRNRIRVMMGLHEEALLAPNGKPSNLSPELYKLVRTPEFKNWFGDWENNPEGASKVVDENGEPLPVYHGTTKEFKFFDERYKGSRGNLREKFWAFTTNYEQAKKYSYDYFGRETNSSRIIPVFLNIKIMPVYDNEGKFYHEFEVWAGHKWAKLFDLHDFHYDGYERAWDNVKFDKADGFCIKNTIEMEKGFGSNKKIDYQSLVGNTYYVKNSNQIKLATGFNVKFNPEDPNIEN